MLFEAGAFSDVVREAQEIVELALKAALRQIGVEPPKQHDVGDLLLAHADRLPPEVRGDLPGLARASKWLRKEREFAFCGDDDFIPTEEYSADDATRARHAADEAVAFARRLIPDG